MLNDKVILTPIKKIKVEGGDVVKNIKDGDLGYKDFKETYYSYIDYGKKRLEKTQRNDP